MFGFRVPGSDGSYRDVARTRCLVSCLCSVQNRESQKFWFLSFSPSTRRTDFCGADIGKFFLKFCRRVIVWFKSGSNNWYFTEDSHDWVGNPHGTFFIVVAWGIPQPLGELWYYWRNLHKKKFFDWISRRYKFWWIIFKKNLKFLWDVDWGLGTPSLYQRLSRTAQRETDNATPSSARVKKVRMHDIFGQQNLCLSPFI